MPLDYNTNPSSPGYKGPFRQSAAPPKKPAARKPVGLSPEAWARKQAEALIATQIKAINDQKMAYLLENSKLQTSAMQRAQAMYAGLMGLNTAGAIQGAYSGAANQIQGTAQGLGDVMEAEAGNAAATDNRILSGSGQEARNEGEGMNEVFSQAQGIIPGSALDRIGRAYAGDAANQPRFDLQEALLNAVRDHAPDTLDFYKQISELQASKPELVMKLMQDRLELRNDRLKMKWALQDRRWEMQDRAYERKQEMEDRAYKQYMDAAKLEMSRGNYERANAYLQLAYEREARMGQKQQFDQQYKKAHPPGSSANQPKWGEIQADISGDIADLTIEIPDPSDKYSPNPRKIEVPMGYEKASKILFQRYSGMVKDKARLRAMIKKILAASGIKPKAPYRGPGSEVPIKPGYGGD